MHVQCLLLRSSVKFSILGRADMKVDALRYS